MKVEVDCWFLKRRKDDVLRESHSIAPGNSENIVFLGKKAEMIVFCQIDNQGGTVLFPNEAPSISATIYEDESDEEGKPVDKNPIMVKGQQELVIASIKGVRREVVVYLSTGEDEQVKSDNPSFSLPVIPKDTRPIIKV